MARKPTFTPAADQPQDGQVVVFATVPTASYCSPGVCYRVGAPRTPKAPYWFTRVDTGASTFDPRWAVARAEFTVVAEV